MSGRIVYRPEQKHDCPHPASDAENAWTIWECQCGDTWTLYPSSGMNPDVDGLWMRDLPDPGIPETGYRPFRWPWRKEEAR